MRLMIIWGSSRQARKGGPVAYFVKAATKTDGRFKKVDFVDLQEMVLPFYDEASSPFSMESLDNYTHPEGRAWAERVAKADAVILVTPEYNHGPPAVLKNALDWVGREWLDKPVGLVSYGGAAGGARAVEQLRSITIELGLINVANAIHFVGYTRSFESGEEPSDRTKEKMTEMFDKLIWFYESLTKKG